VPDGVTPYLIVNGDESEPGLFKDRALLERDPHRVLEGTLIAAFATGTREVFVYIRGEMAPAQEAMIDALREASAAGLVPADISVVVHAGAGAYVVGEETALIESLEGRRGFPRIKPPHPTNVGLYGQPTIVNNVETVATLPWILANGAERYVEMGGGRSAGSRLFCVSGAVRRPGIYELELHHNTFGDLILGQAGGCRPGRDLKAFLTGPSFPWLYPEHLEVRLDVDDVVQHGAPLAPGIVVLDDQTCVVRATWRLTKFFARESCGQCTPCREGTGWMEKILARIENGAGRPDDLDLLIDIGDNISPPPFPRPAHNGLDAVPFPYRMTTICPLGPSAVSAVASSLLRFRDEYDVHLARGCPF
jgi:NADH-quinone oxidoreductase subunit F